MEKMPTYPWRDDYAPDFTELLNAQLSRRETWDAAYLHRPGVSLKDLVNLDYAFFTKDHSPFLRETLMTNTHEPGLVIPVVPEESPDEVVARQIRTAWYGDREGGSLGPTGSIIPIPTATIRRLRTAWRAWASSDVNNRRHRGRMYRAALAQLAQYTSLEAISSIDRELERHWDPQRPPAPSVAHLALELRALRENFRGGYRWIPGSCANELVVTTEPIVLSYDGDRVNLGRFEIHLTSDEGCGRHMWLEALSPEERNGYVHPNIDDGHLCEGDGSAALQKAFASGRLLDYMDIVETILKTISSNPYEPIESWIGAPCRICGGRQEPDDMSYCECCENYYCNDCSAYCESCGTSGCTSCVETYCCTECNKTLCDECRYSCLCGEDENYYCEKCFNKMDNMCDCCRDALAEEEEVAESNDVDAEKPGA